MAIPVMAIMGGLQAGLGLYQSLKAKSQLNKMSRPKYEIPAEIRQNLSAAKLRALEGLPEAQRKNFVQNVQRASSNALNAASDRRSGLAGIAGAQQQEIDAYSNLMSADAQARNQNELRVDAARQNLGDYKEKAFNINEMQPHLEEKQALEAQAGAGIQNIFGGINAAGTDLARMQHANEVNDALGLNPPGDQAGKFAGTNYNAANAQINYNPNLTAVGNGQQGIGMGASAVAPGQYHSPNASQFGSGLSLIGSPFGAGIGLGAHSTASQSPLNPNGTLAGNPMSTNMNQIAPNALQLMGGSPFGFNSFPY